MLTLDMDKVAKGTWVDFYEPNRDGTVPSFLLAHKGDANQRYLLRKEAILKPHRRRLQIGTMPEREAAQLLRQAFVETVLLDWKHFQPNDGGAGDEIKFSAKDAQYYLDMPEMTPLWEFLDNEAGQFERFRQVKLEEEVKN